MDKPLWVAMTPEERKGHTDQLLRHLARIDELEEKKKAAAKRYAADIGEERKEIARLRRVLLADGGQMTLADATVDQVPGEARITETDAQNALAQVAAAAGEKPAEPEVVTLAEVIDLCPRCSKPLSWFQPDACMCTDNACPFVGKLAGTEVKEQLCEGTKSDGSTCGTLLRATEVIKGLCEVCQVGTPVQVDADVRRVAPGIVLPTACPVCSGPLEDVTDFRSGSDTAGMVVGYACAGTAECPQRGVGYALNEDNAHALTREDIDDALEAAGDLEDGEILRTTIDSYRDDPIGEEDDPRPRCTRAGEILTAEEVTAGKGLCFTCEQESAPGMKVTH